MNAPSPQTRVARFTPLRLFLLLSALFELGRTTLLFLAQPLFFDLIQRPMLDPIITRQYGLFSIPVLLFYCLLAWNPIRYRRFLWVAVVQRGLECYLILTDALYATLPWAERLAILAPSLIAALIVLALYPRGAADPATTAPRPVPDSGSTLRTIMAGFGGFQLFWALVSVIFLDVGSRLLGYPVADVYMTQQQGVAVTVIALSSVLIATNVYAYRDFVWVAVTSQGLGILNAGYESAVGTIELYQAGLQWAIQFLIIGAFTYAYLKAVSRLGMQRTPVEK